MFLRSPRSTLFPYTTLFRSIGAGGGFLIVPALVYLAALGVKEAVGTSVLVITLNALSGFAGYIGEVPIDWPLVGSFTGIAARSEEHTSELQSRLHLVCRLLL